MRHAWPFNVRELERVIEGAVLLAQGAEKIGLVHVEAALAESHRAGRAVAPRAVAGDALRERLEALWVEHRGNVSAVARALGKSRAQIHRWRKRWHIGPTRPE
jgi:transcriptional regulator of acetoin/glycerol metabolism